MVLDGITHGDLHEEGRSFTTKAVWRPRCILGDPGGSPDPWGSAMPPPVALACEKLAKTKKNVRKPAKTKTYENSLGKIGKTYENL